MWLNLYSKWVNYDSVPISHQKSEGTVDGSNRYSWLLEVIYCSARKDTSEGSDQTANFRRYIIF